METDPRDPGGRQPDPPDAVPAAEHEAPQVPDDPRVPHRDDAEQEAGHDLGGAAPAVG